MISEQLQPQWQWWHSTGPFLSWAMLHRPSAVLSAIRARDSMQAIATSASISLSKTCLHATLSVFLLGVLDVASELPAPVRGRLSFRGGKDERGSEPQSAAGQPALCHQNPTHTGCTIPGPLQPRCLACTLSPAQAALFQEGHSCQNLPQGVTLSPSL